MSTLYDITNLSFRNLKSMWCMPIWVIVSLIYPILWLILFGSLFSNNPLSVGNQSIKYLDYFAPGMVAATTVFGALWAGTGILYDKERGILNRIYATPLSKISIVWGYVLPSLSGVIVQSCIILFVAYLLGVRYQGNLLSILAAVGVVCLLGFSLSSISHALALFLGRQETLISAINFISLPLLFLSGVLLPLEIAPGWVQKISLMNPVHYGSEILRTLLCMNYPQQNYTKNLSILLIWGIISIVLAMISMRSEE